VDREEVLRRMAKQMPEEEKLQYADFLIHNDEKIPLLPQVLAIHNALIHT